MERDERRRILIELLEHWDDFFAIADTSARLTTTETGDGPGIPVISALSRHASVVELARVLDVCKSMAPGTYKHLRARFQAETRLVEKPTKRRDALGRMVDAVERVREPIVPRWVYYEMRDPAWSSGQRERFNIERHNRMVERGIDFLAGAFNGQPELPLALTRKLRPLADADGWTEAA